MAMGGQPLSEYFDRSYLRSVEENAAAAKLDRDFAKSLVLKLCFKP